MYSFWIFLVIFFFLAWLEFDSPNTHSTEPHLQRIRQVLSLTWLCSSSTFTYMQTIVLEHAEFQFKPLKLLQLQLITAVQTSFLTVQTCLLAFHRKCVRNRYTLQQNVTMRPQLSAFWFRAQNSLKDFIPNTQLVRFWSVRSVLALAIICWDLGFSCVPFLFLLLCEYDNCWHNSCCWSVRTHTKRLQCYMSVALWLTAFLFIWQQISQLCCVRNT